MVFITLIEAENLRYLEIFFLKKISNLHLLNLCVQKEKNQILLQFLYTKGLNTKHNLPPTIKDPIRVLHEVTTQYYYILELVW